MKAVVEKGGSELLRLSGLGQLPLYLYFMI